MTRGFLILAQNTSEVDYVKCGAALAKSIKKNMPNESVTLVTDNNVDTSYKKYFDNIVPLPYGDLASNSKWKLINDWQSYEASPYEYTIKLEADMIIPVSVDYWWNILPLRELVIATTMRNFRQEVSDNMMYRKFITDNKLPNCYSGITYFKKSALAENFFKLCREIFSNWEQVKTMFKCDIAEEATTDWVYAIAAQIIGEDKTTLPQYPEFSFVHMKRFINDLPTDDWTDSLVYEILSHTIRINTCPQLFPLHYHVKTFADTLLQ